MTEQEFRTGFTVWTRIIHIARGALRRARPHVLDHDVQIHMDSLTNSDNEPVRRLLKNRSERAKMAADIRAETTRARQLAAGVALYPLRAAEQHIAECRAWVQARRRDVSVAFPNALDHVDANGMLMFHMLKETVRPIIDHASPLTLLRTYQTLKTDDARSRIDAELIEARIERGGLARTPEEIPIVKELTELVRELQDWRVPLDLPDYEELAADISRLRARATAAQIGVINPDQDSAAAAAYREQEAELLGAGALSDVDDLKAVQQDFAQATGR